MIGYNNKKCGLIGGKLSHSFSPLIHSYLADYSFELKELEPDALEAFVRSKELEAFCVTIPYKKAVIPYLDEISAEALHIGSVNVVVRENDGRLCGYNTDFFGFEYMISLAKIDITNKKAIVLGNGGASLTVCAVLKAKNASSVVVIGRNDNNPKTLELHKDAQIIVNATPVGMFPSNGVSPIDLSIFPRCEAVFDLVYNPARTALMLQAEELGITAIGGLSMLVAQAAKAAELFTKDRCEEGCIESITQKISQSTQNIVLVGMPGCGKSSIGELLAKDLGRDFFDSDTVFKEVYSITPAQAINELGEKKFRQMESEIIKELGKKSSVVIATGGGVVTQECNYAPLHQNGVIVFIQRELNELSSEGRPISQRISVQEIYNRRINSYMRFADIEVSNTGTVCDVVQSIMQKLEL